MTDMITLHPDFMRENLKAAKEEDLIEDFAEDTDGAFYVLPKQCLQWIELNLNIPREQFGSKAIAPEDWVCPLCGVGYDQVGSSFHRAYFLCTTCGYKDSRFYDYRGGDPQSEGYVAWCETCHKYVVNGYCWDCGQIHTRDHIDLSVYDNEPEGGLDVLRACIGVWKFLYWVGDHK